MNEDSAIPGPLNNVIRIDDERIKGHLDRVVRGGDSYRLRAKRKSGLLTPRTPAADTERQPAS